MAELILDDADAIWWALSLALFCDNAIDLRGRRSREHGVSRGHRLGSDELDTIRRELEALDSIEPISDEMRARAVALAASGAGGFRRSDSGRFSISSERLAHTFNF